MTSCRPYRQAMDRAAAVAEIRRCSGAYWSPEVVRALLGVLEGDGAAGDSPVARPTPPAGTEMRPPA